MINHSNRQSVYIIDITLHYYNYDNAKFETHNFKYNQLLTYNISKNARFNNFNSHLIKLSAIDEVIKHLFEDKKSYLRIKIFKDKTIVSDKKFLVKKVSVINSSKSLFNLGVTIISDVANDFIINNRFANASILDTNQVNTNDTSFQTLSSIMQKISGDYGDILSTHYNDAGIITQLHESIRIPDTLNDFKIFDYLFKHFPVYLLEPYFILDDLYNEDSQYSILLINLINIGNNYNLINIGNIKGIRNNSFAFLQSEPLIDYLETKDFLESTIILKNTIENKIYKLTPSVKTEKNKIIETSLNINTYKSKLDIMSRLLQYGATYERYKFYDIDLGDIDFMNAYNMIDKFEYDHTPLIIEYDFKLNNKNTFDLTTTVEFAKLPKYLLTGN